ncbi:MAG: Methyltransferase protein, partial [Dehalococcoidia bacterium]|nr:Methyltransferase protein [Dehalococcoidia bacterium]
LKLVYRPINAIRELSPLARILPYNSYLLWLSQFGFRHNHHVIFDHMAAPVAFYIRREEFESWFREAGLEEVVISWRNQNSWRGWGRLKSRAPVSS